MLYFVSAGGTRRGSVFLNGPFPLPYLRRQTASFVRGDDCLKCGEATLSWGVDGEGQIARVSYELAGGGFDHSGGIVVTPNGL